MKTDPSSDKELSDRLDRLENTLDAAEKRRQDEERAKAPAGDRGLGQAFRLSTEFIAGIIAGAGAGWLFDRFTGLSPWGLIVFLMLGFGAGLLNVLRAAGMISGRRIGDKKP